MVEQLAEHLRGAFRELAREGGAEGKIAVRLDICDAQKGSLSLALDPHLAGEAVPETSQIVASLIADIESLAEESPRLTMGTGLFAQYRALIGIGQKAGGLQVRYRDLSTEISPEREIAFKAALREQVETNTYVVGHIEAVSIHQRPWRFGLYTKLHRERVECYFADAMLEEILKFMERKVLVEVNGEAQYGPVGLTPRSIVLDAKPMGLDFDPSDLLAFRRASDIVLEGETAADAVDRVRKETGALA